MPRIIVKCKYYKNAASGNLGGLMKYIATREGVEKLPKEQRALPATDNQQQFITQIVSRNNAIRTTPEYKAFMKAEETVSHEIKLFTVHDVYMAYSLILAVLGKYRRSK